MRGIESFVIRRDSGLPDFHPLTLILPNVCDLAWPDGPECEPAVSPALAQLGKGQNLGRPALVAPLAAAGQALSVLPVSDFLCRD